VILLVSDTHGTTDHEMRGRTLEAAREAELVLHAGDFTTRAVYDAIADECADLVAVQGNRDKSPLCTQLPTETEVEHAGVRIALTHGHEHSETGLAMLGRQADADLVVFGHSHRPTLIDTDDVTLVNPGSYADPRGNRPGHVELEVTNGGSTLDGTFCEPDGTVFEKFSVERE
jgi:hypothetical protein